MQTVVVEKHATQESLDTLAIPAAKLAKMLSISIRTLRVWAESGRLPKPEIEIRKVIRWRVATIEEWLADGCPRRTERARK